MLTGRAGIGTCVCSVQSHRHCLLVSWQMWPGPEGPGSVCAEAMSERGPAHGMKDPILEWTLLSKRQHVSQALAQDLEPEPWHCHLSAEAPGNSVFLLSCSFQSARRCPPHRAVTETQQNQTSCEHSPRPGTEWAHSELSCCYFNHQE